MAIDFTKANVKAMVEVLDQDHESLTQAAEAALEAAVAIIEGRAKFTVVGQIKAPDNKGDKFSLGLFVTEKQAFNEALKGTYSVLTREEARLWVVPISHGSSFDYYKQRKSNAENLELAEKGWREKEIARRVKWYDEHPGEPVPESWGAMPVYESDLEDCSHCEGMGKVKRGEPS